MLRAVSEDVAEPSAATESAGRILVVDDEPQLLRLMARVLARDAYEIQEALDGTIALGLAGTAPPVLAIIDLSIPPEGGAAFMRELATSLPDVRIVLTSGADLDADLYADLVQLGGSFLRKPFAPRTLSEMVKRTLAGESHPDGLNGSG